MLRRILTHRRLGKLPDPALGAIVDAVGLALADTDAVRRDATRLEKRIAACKR